MITMITSLFEDTGVLLASERANGSLGATSKEMKRYNG
jgi:hypothetical protein